jgi:uncharacterized repeat protein (TIGR01451 family)
MTLTRRSALGGVLALVTLAAACADDPVQPGVVVPDAASLTTVGAAVMSVTPDSYDFGDVVVLTTSPTKLFTLANTGTADMILNAVSLTGDNAYDFALDNTVQPRCLDGLSLAAGASCVIGVKLNAVYIRPDTASLAISTTAGDTLIPLTGNSIPAVRPTPQAVTFGDQIVGTQSAPQTIQIENLGAYELYLYNYILDNPDEFIVTGASSNACQLDVPMAAGATCDLTVAFKPSATGARSTSVLIVSNNGSAVATLSGTGLPASADVSVAMTGTLQGKSIVYQITVKNAGPSTAENVTVSDVMPAGTTFNGITVPGDFGCEAPRVGTTGPVTCTVGTLPSGAVRTLQLTVKVSGGTRGSLVNTASASAASPADPATGNNTASVTTVVGRK